MFRSSIRIEMEKSLAKTQRSLLFDISSTLTVYHDLHYPNFKQYCSVPIFKNICFFQQLESYSLISCFLHLLIVQRQPSIRQYKTSWFIVILIWEILVIYKIIGEMSIQKQLQPSIAIQQQTTLLANPQSSDNEPISANEQQVKQQQQAKNTYLKNMLDKYTVHADSVQFFTFSKYKQFHEEIMNGRYEIKQRQWSAEEDKLKASRSQAQKNNSEAIWSRKRLGNQQELDQSQLKDNQKVNKEMSEEERIGFMKRMEKEKKELLRKKQEKAKLSEEKRKEQQRKNKQILQKQQNQRKIKKQQQISQRLKMLEQNRKKKEEQYKNQTLALKQKMKEQTLTDKIQQNYHQKQHQSLQQRKKRLSQIRMLHKPIDRTQLEAHAQKLQKLHAERQAALTAANSQKSKQKPSIAFYKSIFYKRVKQQQKIFIDKRNQEQLSKLRQKRDKLKKFSQHIKSSFKPQIDQEKVQQIKFRSVNLRNKSFSSKQHDNPKKVGLRYLQYSKLQVGNQKLLVSNQTQEEEQEKPKKYDYLAQLRKMNKNRTSQSAHDFLNKLDRQGISKEEKAKKIFQFTSKIEQAAKRKQQLHKIGTNNLDDGLDTLYLQAIQAKLGLLQDY